MSLYKHLFFRSRRLNQSKPTQVSHRCRPWAELLEDRLAPASSASLLGTTLVITGDDTANLITVRLVTGDSSKTEVLDRKALLGTFSNSSFLNILTSLNGGDDTLTLDSSNGNPIPVAGVSYDGGSGTNTFTGPGVANTWSALP